MKTDRTAICTGPKGIGGCTNETTFIVARDGCCNLHLRAVILMRSHELGHRPGGNRGRAVTVQPIYRTTKGQQ